MLHRRNFAVVIVCIAVLLCAGGAAQARDHSFTAVLAGLKQNYQLKPQAVVGVWFAKCIVKAIPTPGVSKIDFVLLGKTGFQDFSNARDLNTQIHGMLGPDWKPFVQMDSTKDRQHAVVFARPNGRRMDLFVVYLDPDRTIAAFARVDAKGLKKWIN